MTRESERIIEALTPFVEPRRIARMATVLSQRTGRIHVVFENLHDPQNGAAGLRSAEALGLHRVHVVESYSPFGFHEEVSCGAEKWMQIERYPTTARCVDALRKAGLRIIAADLTPSARPLESLALEGPVAVVFGNEHRGVSSQMRRAVVRPADLRLHPELQPLGLLCDDLADPARPRPLSRRSEP